MPFTVKKEAESSGTRARPNTLECTLNTVRLGLVACSEDCECAIETHGRCQTPFSVHSHTRHTWPWFEEYQHTWRTLGRWRTPQRGVTYGKFLNPCRLACTSTRPCVQHPCSQELYQRIPWLFHLVCHLPPGTQHSCDQELHQRIQLPHHLLRQLSPGLIASSFWTLMAYCTVSSARHFSIQSQCRL